MKKVLFVISGIAVVFLIVIFTIKLNKTGVGKYVPMGQRMILNTSYGKVYIPKKSDNYGVLKWKEFISFKTENDSK